MDDSKVIIKNPEQIPNLSIKELSSSEFRDKTIFICSSFKLACHILHCFAQLYLLRELRWSREKISNLSIVRSGPCRKNRGAMFEALGLDPSPMQETWLIVSQATEEAKLLEQYLAEGYSDHNEDFSIKDERINKQQTSA